MQNRIYIFCKINTVSLESLLQWKHNSCKVCCNLQSYYSVVCSWKFSILLGQKYRLCSFYLLTLFLNLFLRSNSLISHLIYTFFLSHIVTSTGKIWLFLLNNVEMKMSSLFSSGKITKKTTILLKQSCQSQESWVITEAEDERNWNWT